MASYPYKTRNKVTTSQATENALKIIQGRSLTRDVLLEKSPVPVPKKPGEQFSKYIECLFGSGDIVYVARAEFVGTSKRTRPLAHRVAKSRDHWSKAWDPERIDQFFPGPGSFISLNSVSDSIAAGYTFGDVDVAKFDYVLVESDVLPTEMQCNLLASLAIPIVALIDSGGKSIHGIVRVGGRDAADYKAKVAVLFNYVVKVGADPNTKNPGRLTRLPGGHSRN